MGGLVELCNTQNVTIKKVEYINQWLEPKVVLVSEKNKAYNDTTVIKEYSSTS